MSTTAGIPPQKISPPAGSSPEAKSAAQQRPLSTLAGKYVMAVTGMALAIFVFFHMLGNLQVFLGREALNAYAHFLQSNKEILWFARITLLVFLVVHMVMAVNIVIKNKAARPIGYAYPRKYEEANISSRSMFLSGLVIFAFLIYHLLHFTITPALTPPDQRVMDPVGHPDVYGMVVRSFREPLIVATYIVAQIFLGLHLWHAIPSMFQSLGINRPRWQADINRFGAVFTIVVVGGNILIPTLILMGLFPDPIEIVREVPPAGFTPKMFGD